MSTTIEQKVVEMKFDNSNFEKNVQTSMSTLDKLKEALNKTTSANAFEELGRAANKLDFGGLASQVQTVADKFSVWEEIAIGALRNIGASIEQHIAQNIKKLTVDNVISGWERFAQKTESVQTILSAIASDTENDYGEDQLAYVEDLLEKLAWYSDETSYGFTDMTDNISKFVAAGLNLDVSTDAMMGIANWAAMSGQNASVAARAMYQLSQAMGMGSIRLMDWKSIEVANMATKEVKEMLLEYAALSKDSIVQMDEYGYYINNVTKKGTERIDVDYKNFRETLKYGWLTADAFSAAMADYSSYSNALYEILNSESNEGKVRTATELIEQLDDAMKIAKETGRTLDDIMLNEYHVDLMVDDGNGGLRNALDGVTELGIRAMKAAQQARTWKQVIDSITDAASTQWSFIFENIFGNVEEATELFTELSEFFYDVFVEPLWSIRDTITAWKELGGRVLLFGGEETSALHNLEKAWFALSNAITKGFRSIFPATTAEQIYNATERFRDWTATLILGEDKAEKVSHAVSVVADTFKRIASIFGSAFSAVKTVLGQLQNVMGRVFNNEFFEGPITGIRSFFIQLTSAVKSFFDNFKLSNSVLEKFETILMSIRSVLNLLGKAFGTFSGKLAKLLRIDDGGEKSGIQKFAEFLGGTFLDIILFIPTQIANLIQWIVDLFTYSNTLKSIGSSISSVFESLKNFISGIKIVFGKEDLDGGKFEKARKSIYSLLETLRDSEFIQKAKEGLASFFESVSEWFSKNVTLEKSVEIFTKVKNALSSFGDIAQSVGEKVAGFASAIWDGLKKAASAIRSFFGKGGSGDIDRSMPGLATAKELNRRDAVGGGPSADMSGRPGEGILRSIDEDAGAFSLALEEFGKIEETGSKVQAVLDRIKGIWEKAKELISKSGIGAWIVDKLTEIKNLFSGLGNEVESIAETSESVLTPAEKIKTIFEKIKSTFEELLKLLAETLPGIGLGAAGIGTGGLLSGIGSFFRKSGTAFKWLADGFQKFGKAASKTATASMITSVGYTLSKTLKAIGEMAIMLAAAALIFSKIDKTDNLLEASAVMAGFIFEIFSAIAVITKISTKNALEGIGNAAVLTGVSSILTSLGISLILIAIAIKKVADVIESTNPEAFQDAVDVLMLLILESLGLMAAIVANSGAGGTKIVGVSSLMLALAIAVDRMAVVTEKIGKMDKGQLQNGIGWFSVFTGILGLFVTLVSTNQKMGSSGFGLLEMVAAIGVLILIAQKTGELWQESTALQNGVIAIGLVGLILATVAKIVSSNNDVITAGTAFVLMAAGVVLIAAAINQLVPAMTIMSQGGEGLAAGIVAIIGVLAIIAVMAVALKKLSKDADKVGKAALALDGMALALGVVAGIVTLFAAIVNGDNGLLSLGIAIGAFVLILGSLVAAALLTKNVSDEFLMFGAAVALFGTGIGVAAAGIAALLEAIYKLTTSTEMEGQRMLSNTTNLVQSLALAIANSEIEITQAVTVIIVALLAALANSAVQISETVITIINTILDLLIKHGPEILEKVGTILDMVLDFIFGFLEKVLKKLEEFVPDAIKTIKDLVSQVIDAILGEDGLVKQLLDGVFGLANDILDALSFKKQGGLGYRILEEIYAIIDGICELLAGKDGVLKLFTAAKDFMGGFIEGIGECITTAVGAFGEVIIAICESVGDFVEDLVTAFIGLINSLADTIERHTGEFWTAVVRLAKALVDAIFYPLSGGSDKDGSLANLGKHILEGLANGISNAWDAVKSTIESVGSRVVQKFKDIFGIKSPSRVMAEMGMYLDEGLSKGLLDNVSGTEDAAESVGDNVIDSLSKVLSDVNGILSDDDFVPTITPVMDLSQIQNGMSTMGGMLSQYDDSYSLNAALAARYSPFVDANGEAILSPDERISARIDNLQQKFDDMIYKLGKIQVVLDSGAVVGELVDPMDEALGRKSVYVGRGMLTYG